MTTPLRHVAIAGGGIAAALTALGLARRIPKLSVTWIDTGTADASIEDMLGMARPSLTQFHRALGLDDADLLRRIHYAPRWGTRVEGWSAQDFFRGHGRLPSGVHGLPIHLLWLRMSDHDMPGRPEWIEIAHAAATDSVAPALLLDLDDYRAALDTLAKSTAIQRIVSHTFAVETDLQCSRIKSIRLPDGKSIAADLFVDATGPARLLSSRLAGDWIDWSHQLPTRTLYIERRPPALRPAKYDRLIADADGWRVQVDLPNATLCLWGRGEGDAVPNETSACLSVSPGRLTKPFNGNVVALGSAAAVLDPIDATALHLLCRQIERLIAYWPGHELNPVETALYNRRSALDADRMRDFTQLHYIASKRGTSFWQSAKGAVSDKLSNDLILFKARGRFLSSDEDGFEADEWIATLLGLGYRPEQHDALASAVPIALARQCIASAIGRAREKDMR